MGQTTIFTRGAYSSAAALRVLMFELHSVVLDIERTNTPSSESLNTRLNLISRMEGIINRPGFDVEGRDDDNVTHLMEASKLGLVSVSELLIHKGANVDARDSANWDAFKHAYKEAVSLPLS